MKLFKNFTTREFSGSLGDLGLFIPLVVAMTIACDLNIGMVLILAGLMNIITGIIFCQPIPVQPMKAIAAVVITEGFLKEEMFAAGLIMGAFLLFFSLFINQITKIVPNMIVRGIQLGIGLKLAITGLIWIISLPPFGLNSICLAAFITIILFLFSKSKQPVLLYIFLVGFLILQVQHPYIFSYVGFRPVVVEFSLPPLSAFEVGLWKGAVPQLPLTLLNSVIAVCALSADYFPKKGISPQRMAASVGLMNLVCIPFGGIPMCHGAGGLAAQYRFGARTGASVIMLGIMKVVVGLVFGGSLLFVFKHYPLAILAPMLIFAGMELNKTLKYSLNLKRDLVAVLVMAIVILNVNTLAGFLTGCGFVLLYQMYDLIKLKLG